MFALDYATRQDLYQDAEVFLLENAKAVSHARNPEAYKYTILHNHIINRIRKYRNGIPPQQYCDNQPVFDPELHEINITVSHLPAPERRLVYQKFYQHHTIKHIAKVHGVSQPTIFRRLAAILRKLRKVV